MKRILKILKTQSFWQVQKVDKKLLIYLIIDKIDDNEDRDEEVPEAESSEEDDENPKNYVDINHDKILEEYQEKIEKSAMLYGF